MKYLIYQILWLAVLLNLQGAQNPATPTTDPFGGTPQPPQTSGPPTPNIFPWERPPYFGIYKLLSINRDSPEDPEERAVRQAAILALPPEADQYLVDLLEFGWFSPEYRYSQIASSVIDALLARGTLPRHVRDRLDALTARMLNEKERIAHDGTVAESWIADHWKFDPPKGEKLAWQFLDAGHIWIWGSTGHLLAKTGNNETISRLKGLAQYVATRWPDSSMLNEIQETIDAIKKRLAAEKPAFDGLRPPGPGSGPEAASAGGVIASTGASTAKPDTTGWIFASLLAVISLAALFALRAAFRRR